MAILDSGIVNNDQIPVTVFFDFLKDGSKGSERFRRLWPWHTRGRHHWQRTKTTNPMPNSEALGGARVTSA